jgi:hypothetical protein
LVIEPRRLRAPRQSGAFVAEPPLDHVGALLAANRTTLAGQAASLFGRPWAELRRQARQAALAAARAYHQQAGEPVPDLVTDSLLLAGHQPELFHPGVWVKNFALNGLARAHQATPLNLVVDNDTAKTTSLRLPDLGNASEPFPHLTSIAFDRWSGEVPYEERTIQDEALFADLPAEAAAVLGEWDFTPLLASFWQEVRTQAARSRMLGESLVAARRVFERRWGCHNLELPVSLLCQTEPFAMFACHLLADLPRFHGIYNACVQDHRHRYGIRSRNHPVPDLGQAGDWLEAPFWAWRSGQGQRGRLFARWTKGAVELRVGADSWPAFPLASGKATDRTLEAWCALEGQSLKIRSRALTNTLFARLFLADLFIHGIGGGKYDELTDEICRRFYGCDLPDYLVLSATLLLPFPTFPTSPVMQRGLRRELRDVRYNPQRHLAGEMPASVSQVVQAKQALIGQAPEDANGRRQRFQGLRLLTERLRPFASQREAALERERLVCEQELQANAVLERRDYAFCLYPETTIRPFCTQFLTS